jgi:hypothetical protein
MPFRIQLVSCFVLEDGWHCKHFYEVYDRNCPHKLQKNKVRYFLILLANRSTRKLYEKIRLMKIFREESYIEMKCDVSIQTTAHVTAFHYYSKKEKQKITIYIKNIFLYYYTAVIKKICDVTSMTLCCIKQKLVLK